MWLQSQFFVVYGHIRMFQAVKNTKGFIWSTFEGKLSVNYANFVEFVRGKV